MAEDLKNLNRDRDLSDPFFTEGLNNKDEKSLKALLEKTELEKEALEARLKEVSNNIDSKTTLTQTDMLKETASQAVPLEILNPNTANEATVLASRIEKLNAILSGNVKINTTTSDDADRLTRMTQGDLN